MWVLAGCGPQATPFPADVPTPTVEDAAGATAAPIRYALAANTQEFIADLEAIRASASVEFVGQINPDDLGNRYDLVAAYGDFPDGIRSPIVPHVALVINPNFALMNNPVVARALRTSLNPVVILGSLNIPGAAADALEIEKPETLRTALANEGLPDGVSLVMAYAYTPGVVQVIGQFRAAGIQVEPVLMSKGDVTSAFAEKRVQVALLAWTSPDERQSWANSFGGENVLDLYTLPISYRAAAVLKIAFTADGWPLATR